MNNEVFDRTMSVLCDACGYIFWDRKLQNERLEVIVEVKPKAVTGAKESAEALQDRLTESMPFPYYSRVVVL
jgi:hypothetical protein